MKILSFEELHNLKTLLDLKIYGRNLKYGKMKEGILKWQRD